MGMAPKFALAQQVLNDLSNKATFARIEYTGMMAYFNHTGMKSSDFIVLFDNFFVPSDLLLNKPDPIQKKRFFPALCRWPTEPTVEDFLALWEIGGSEKLRALMEKKRRKAAR